MTNKFQDIFNNKQPLESCEFPTLTHGLGIRVGSPFFNIGANKHNCEVTLERPSINTSSFDRNTPIEELNKQALLSGESILKN